jgi:four helix bundle protein
MRGFGFEAHAFRKMATGGWDILRAGLSPALDPTLSPSAGLAELTGLTMFSLEKLKVYDRALASVASLAQLSAHWDKRHAVVDQLQRASESVVLNIAEGARLRSSPQRQHLLDYAIGSTLECAACLDIAQRKQWILQTEALHQKRALCEIVRMLFGLRRAWKGDELHEEAGGYKAQEPWLFAHERLEAYQCSLKVVAWFHALPGGAELSTRWFRQLDKAATSVVLNIAEGNGRRMEADHRRFVELAESSVMKVNTYIQLSQRTGEMSLEPAQRGLALVDRVALLVRGLAGNA